MGFSTSQIAELDADLDPAHVSDRNQAGRKLSYIEGWHAIAEANRIFGHDAWWRETVEIKCVAEFQRPIGPKKEPGWGITYTAKVRVTVYADGDATIVRDGCGTGHGIDRDCGQAHESAIKEAETDAMKRALMTFGWPFGLALYDKSQSHVGKTEKVEQLPKAKTRGLFQELQDDVREVAESSQDVATINRWWLENKPKIATLKDDWQELLIEECKRLKAEIEAKEVA